MTYNLVVMMDDDYDVKEVLKVVELVIKKRNNSLHITLVNNIIESFHTTYNIYFYYSKELGYYYYNAYIIRDEEHERRIEHKIYEENKHRLIELCSNDIDYYIEDYNKQIEND